MAGRGFVVAGERLFAADQWSNMYRTAKVDDMSQPFLAYDDAHQLLHSSNFAGGIWRNVIP